MYLPSGAGLISFGIIETNGGGGMKGKFIDGFAINGGGGMNGGGGKFNEGGDPGDSI